MTAFVSVSMWMCVRQRIVACARMYVFVTDTVMLASFLAYLSLDSDPAKPDRLVGQVFKVSAARAEDSGFESRLRLDFSGVESCQ